MMRWKGALRTSTGTIANGTMRLRGIGRGDMQSLEADGRDGIRSRVEAKLGSQKGEKMRALMTGQPRSQGGRLFFFLRVDD